MLPNLLTVGAYTMHLEHQDNLALILNITIGVICAVVFLCQFVIMCKISAYNMHHLTKHHVKHRGAFLLLLILMIALTANSISNCNNLPTGQPVQSYRKECVQMNHLRKIYPHLPNHVQHRTRPYTKSINHDLKYNAGQSYKVMSKSQAINKYFHLKRLAHNNSPVNIRKHPLKPWNYI